MVKNWCPNGHKEAFEYVRCFCGLSGIDANPFSPWPTTTTTTLPLSPAPPLPPPSPTPAPPAPGPACMLTDKCIQGLGAHFQCYNIKRNGGHECYKGISLWQKNLTEQYGCPQFMDDSKPVFESKAFCWCGLDNSSSSSTLQLAPPRVSSLALVQGGLCSNGYDRGILKWKPKWLIQQDTYECGQEAQQCGPKGCDHPPFEERAASCMQKMEHKPTKYGDIHITSQCASCFGQAIACSNQNCRVQCACSPKPPGESPDCHYCVKFHCQKQLNFCTGLPSSASDEAFHLTDSTNVNSTTSILFTV